jgi:hypothetical protein
LFSQINGYTFHFISFGPYSDCPIGNGFKKIVNEIDYMYIKIYDDELGNENIIKNTILVTNEKSEML